MANQKLSEILRISLNMDLKKTSLSILSWHVYIWKMTGLYPMKYTENWKKYCHYCFCIILHGSFTFYYAFSITFQSFLVTRIKDLLANIFISATFIAIFIKLIVIRKNSSYFTHILELSCEFEEKYKESKFAQEQQKIFKRKTRTYSISICTATLSLLYEAYFPFDPLEGDLRYGAIMFYQTIGWLYMGYINVFADSYPTILIYLLTNDMNILGDQISQIAKLNDMGKITRIFPYNNQFYKDCNKSGRNKYVSQKIFDSGDKK
uniref:Odorant receptor n=1 Tax=Megaselia scalaris TaxID=36166 RepID=T1GA75_MEGSC